MTERTPMVGQISLGACRGVICATKRIEAETNERSYRTLGLENRRKGEKKSCPDVAFCR